LRSSRRGPCRHSWLPGSWTTYELRHSSVSIISAQGISIEAIADYAGHKNSRVTSTVYRHSLSPVVRSAQGVMQGLFGSTRRPRGRSWPAGHASLARIHGIDEHG
jgi:integrase